MLEAAGAVRAHDDGIGAKCRRLVQDFRHRLSFANSHAVKHGGVEEGGHVRRDDVAVRYVNRIERGALESSERRCESYGVTRRFRKIHGTENASEHRVLSISGSCKPDSVTSDGFPAVVRSAACS